MALANALVPWQLSHVFSVETAWWTRAGSVDTRVFTSFSLAEHPYELSEAFLTPRTPLAKTHKTRGDEAQALADGSDLWAGAEELRGLGRGWGAAQGSRCLSNGAGRTESEHCFSFSS